MTREPLPRYWLSRALIAFLSLSAVLVSMREFETYTHKVLIAPDPVIGSVCMIIMGVIAVLALLDVLINDLSPEAWRLRFARQHRHVVYMSLAIGNAMVAAIIFKNSGPNWLLLQPLMIVAVATWLAFCDALNRYKETT